jgi:hypothetical protein
MLEELFTFPIVMIDGENEEKKQEDRERLGDILSKPSEDDEYDIIYGEAEYPYWDFIGVEDRWLPTSGSLQKAIDGKFDACIVKFVNVGQLLVPWSKKKFKSEITKFGEAYNTKKPAKDRELKVITLSPEQVEKIMKDGKREEEE